MKYLKDSDIKVNHWYKDNKGEILLYLGTASQDDGVWEYPESHIYLKKHIVEKHFKVDANTIPVKEALTTMSDLGVRHYFFTQKPRKFVEEVARHPDTPLKGSVGIFSFH